MKRQTSIQNRLIRVILMTTGAVLILTYASYLIYEIISYREITKRNLTILSNVIAANSTASLAFDDAGDSREILSGLRAETNIDAACIFRANGEVFSFYPDSLSVDDFATIRQRNGFDFGKNSIEGFTPIMQDDKRLGTLYIKRNLNDSSERLMLYSVIALVIVALSFLLAYLLSSRLQRKISHPIIALSNASGMVSRYHDYSIRATKHSDDEIGLLTDAFNNMLSQIQIQNTEIHKNQEKLQRHAEELEHAVSQRTRELRIEKEFAESVINSSIVLIAVFDTEMRFISYNN
jgi:methyl-accepting chemotaxis protein